MNRARFSIRMLLCLIGLIALAFASYRIGLRNGRGVVGSANVSSAKFVSLEQLDAAASDKTIYYHGSNKHFHYLLIEDAGYFKVRCSEASIPQVGFEGDGFSSVGMIHTTLTIENGRFKANDAPTGSL